MTDLFRLDNWIPDNPTEEDFKSKFSETWNYPSKKDQHKKRIRKYYDQNRKYRKEIRNKVIAFYSNNKNECACCGLKDRNNLTIDHVHGGGNQHRKENRSRSFFAWLYKNNFPSGYQILCFGCNNSKNSYDKCKINHDEK